MNRFFPLRTTRSERAVAQVALSDDGRVTLADALGQMADRLAERLVAFEERDAGDPARDEHPSVDDGYRTIAAEERARISQVRELARMVAFTTGGDELRKLTRRSLMAIDRGSRFEAQRLAVLTGGRRRRGDDS